MKNTLKFRDWLKNLIEYRFYNDLDVDALREYWERGRTKEEQAAFVIAVPKEGKEEVIK